MEENKPWLAPIQEKRMLLLFLPPHYKVEILFQISVLEVAIEATFWQSYRTFKKEILMLRCVNIPFPEAAPRALTRFPSHPSLKKSVEEISLK